MESIKTNPEKSSRTIDNLRKVGATVLLSISFLHLSGEAKDSMADQFGDEAAAAAIFEGHTAKEAIAIGNEVEAEYSIPDYIKDVTFRNQNRLRTGKDMFLGDEEGFDMGNIINIAAMATLAGGLANAQYKREKRRKDRKSFNSNFSNIAPGTR